MVNKFKENYLPEDYEILLHKKRQSLKQKDMDVASILKNFKCYIGDPRSKKMKQ